jgi:hypothetical protein
MKQYQKNGKMTMRLRRCGVGPDDAAAPGIDGGMEAEVALAASPAIGIAWPIKRSIHDVDI